MSAPGRGFETTDGCWWTITWMYAAEAWLVDVYVDDDDPPPGPCTCAHPENGLFDRLETVELALGSPIPAAIRELLLVDAASFTQPESDRGAWGRTFTIEVIRADEDGNFTYSVAPTWTDVLDPPDWDPDNFPLAR